MQSRNRGGRSLDHVMLIARDLARAKSCYERMGFNVTPLAFHPHGTANHLIMFQRNFVELLGVVAPDQLDARSHGAQTFLQVREGVAALALPSDDAKGDREDLVARGLEPSDVYSFDREVELPDGRDTRAIVDTVWCSPRSAPLVQTFLSQQHVSEAIWVEEWQRHPNGAQNLTWTMLVADEHERELRTHLGALLETKAIGDGEGCLTFAMGAGELRVVTPAHYEARYGVAAETTRPYIAGIGLRVDDLEALAGCIERGGVPHETTSRAVRVLPDSAVGVLLEFTA